MHNLTQVTVIRRIHRSSLTLCNYLEDPDSVLYQAGFFAYKAAWESSIYQNWLLPAVSGKSRWSPPGSLWACSSPHSPLIASTMFFLLPPPTHSATTLEGTRSRECVHTTRKGRSNHHRAKGWIQWNTHDRHFLLLFQIPVFYILIFETNKYSTYKPKALPSHKIA